MEQSVIRSDIEYCAPHYVTPLQLQLRLAELSGHHDRIRSSPPAPASIELDASLTPMPTMWIRRFTRSLLLQLLQPSLMMMITMMMTVMFSQVAVARGTADMVSQYFEVIGVARIFPDGGGALSIFPQKLTTF